MTEGKKTITKTRWNNINKSYKWTRNKQKYAMVGTGRKGIYGVYKIKIKNNNKR